MQCSHSTTSPLGLGLGQQRNCGHSLQVIAPAGKIFSHWNFHFQTHDQNHLPWVLFSVSSLHFDIEDTEPIILKWRLGVLWLAGIDHGDDEHITVSLDIVTEHTPTVSVGVEGTSQCTSQFPFPLENPGFVTV